MYWFFHYFPFRKGDGNSENWGGGNKIRNKESVVTSKKRKTYLPTYRIENRREREEKGENGAGKDGSILTGGIVLYISE